MAIKALPTLADGTGVLRLKIKGIENCTSQNMALRVLIRGTTDFCPEGQCTAQDTEVQLADCFVIGGVCAVGGVVSFPPGAGFGAGEMRGFRVVRVPSDCGGDYCTFAVPGVVDFPSIHPPL